MPDIVETMLARRGQGNIDARLRKALHVIAPERVANKTWREGDGPVVPSATRCHFLLLLLALPPPPPLFPSLLHGPSLNDPAGFEARTVQR